MWRWQQRYAEAGVEGLLRDKMRTPGTPPHPTETVAEVLALTCSEPPGEVTHWTGRFVARAVGISLRAMQRIWDAHRLHPHRLRTFKRSRDPAFAARVENGHPSNLFDGCPAASASPWTYPRTRWCCPSTILRQVQDKESQIQALERTRPDRPLAPAIPPSRPTTIPVTAPRRCLPPSTS